MMKAMIVVACIVSILSGGCASQVICDIGNESTAGDYTTVIISGMPSIMLDRECAIQDCLAYNKAMNETMCVV
jgi:uncharacterized protein YceK